MAAKKVLIVEDDSTLASALAGAVKKAGYESLICRKPDEALSALDRDSFKVVFIDCLLPQIPGVEVAKTIRKSFDAQMLPIVMMSGVFTDKQMMKDVSQEVSAVDFLKKPFEVNEVLKFLEKDSASTGDEKLAKSLFSLPDRLGANPSNRSAILKEIKFIHGFELPLLISSLVENSFSGILNLNTELGVFNKISFSKGHIVRVESSDAQNFLGKLLVSGGWVLPEDLEVELNKSSDKKIGQRLVEENLISPHAVYEVMERQMALRIESLISDKVFKVDFDYKNIETFDDSSIDPEEYFLLLDRWISEKVTGIWINQQMSQWQSNSIRLSPSHDSTIKEYDVSLIKATTSIIETLESVNILSLAQERHKQKLTEFNKAFYYLICLRYVLLSEKPSMSEGERTVRLQRLWTQMKDLNLIEVFQLMGGKRDMSPSETQQIFEKFSQQHVMKISTESLSSNSEELMKSIKGKTTSAYSLFMEPDRVVNYERELETGKVSKRSEAQAKIEEAKKYLSLRQFSSALILVNKASELFPNLDFLNLYKVWSMIGLLSQAKNRAQELIEITQIMSKISVEEKNTTIGNFVQGLVAKAKGEFAAAKDFFEKCLLTDKGFIEARRELNTLPSLNDEKKPVDLLHGDLSQVVRHLFKK